MAATVKGTVSAVKREGIEGAGVGEHPLTLWLIAAVVIVWLYIRRSNLGLDTHPAEGKIVKPAPKLQPSISLPPVGATAPSLLPGAAPWRWGAPLVPGPPPALRALPPSSSGSLFGR